MAGLKKGWRELWKGRPGHRFQDRFRQRKQRKVKESAFRRFFFPVLGVLLAAAGIVFCVIPGPGLPLLIVGAALLAERSRPLAVGLDWIEVAVRKLLRRAQAWWGKASMPAQATAIIFSACVVGGAGYLAYQVFLG